MNVKELIEALSEFDGETRVVVDLIEGAFDLEPGIGIGGLGAPSYQRVVWLTPSKVVDKIALRCEYCDGSGYVVRADGELWGLCPNGH